MWSFNGIFYVHHIPYQIYRMIITNILDVEIKQSNNIQVVFIFEVCEHLSITHISQLPLSSRHDSLVTTAPVWNVIVGVIMIYPRGGNMHVLSQGEVEHGSEIVSFLSCVTLSVSCIGTSWNYGFLYHCEKQMFGSTVR